MFCLEKAKMNTRGKKFDRFSVSQDIDWKNDLTKVLGASTKLRWGTHNEAKMERQIRCNAKVFKLIRDLTGSWPRGEKNL